MLDPDELLLSLSESLLLELDPLPLLLELEPDPLPLLELLPPVFTGVAFLAAAAFCCAAFFVAAEAMEREAVGFLDAVCFLLAAGVRGLVGWDTSSDVSSRWLEVFYRVAKH